MCCTFSKKWRHYSPQDNICLEKMTQNNTIITHSHEVWQQTRSGISTSNGRRWKNMRQRDGKLYLPPTLAGRPGSVGPAPSPSAGRPSDCSALSSQRTMVNKSSRSCLDSSTIKAHVLCWIVSRLCSVQSIVNYNNKPLFPHEYTSKSFRSTVYLSMYCRFKIIAQEIVLPTKVFVERSRQQHSMQCDLSNKSGTRNQWQI